MPKSAKPFFLVFSLLVVAYGAWLMVFWPGILGQDSLALLVQIEGGNVQSGKPVFWYLFVKWLYEPHRRVEVPIIVQLFVCAAIFARMLAWTWTAGMKKTFFFVLLFIALAPHVAYFEASLYSDALFAVAVAGLTFEAWLIVRDRRVSGISLLFLALLIPFAVFLRANGYFMLVIVIPLLLAVPRADKLKVLAVFGIWIVIYLFANYTHKSLHKHGALFPLAIFETVNFLQPHPLGLRRVEDYITPETIALLEKQKPIGEILKFYDRDYWDPLVYLAAGPAFLDFTKEQKAQLAREFFCCNLWNNFPAFMASRVNIFLVSALAQGGFGGPDEIYKIMPLIKSTSTLRAFDMGPVEGLARASLLWSFGQRWWLWTPFLGIGLLVAVMRRTWRRRDWLPFLVVAPLALQLAGVFAFSIASEYRYLLFIFTSVAALLPIHVATRAPSGNPNARIP